MKEFSIRYATEMIKLDHTGFVACVPTSQNYDWAQKISDWTQNSTMLAKTPDDMVALFERGHSVVMVNAKGEPVSHAAATFVYSDGSIEVGGVVTPVEHSRKGLATHAVAALITHLQYLYPEQLLFALANEKSAPLFAKIGGQVMQSWELSSEVWGPCASCTSPKKTHTACCDTAYKLTNVYGGKFL